MKIVITGATGLLGSNLVRLLANLGYQIVCTKRRESRTDHLKDLPIRWIEADLNDLDSLKRAFDGVEVVFHCAALVGYGPIIDRTIEQTNIKGTQNVVDAIRATGVRRLIHCSSVDALGLPDDNYPADETTPWNWDKHGVDYGYPRSKFLSERIVLQASGIDAVVVNPSFMIGAFDTKPSSGRLVLRIAKGWLPFYPSGTNNFVDVQDVCRGMVLALEKGRRGERYILGGVNLTYQEFFRLVTKCVSRRSMHTRIPRIFAICGGLLGDLFSYLTGMEFDLNSQTAKLGYLSHQYQSAKAQRELGYTWQPIESAINDAVRWFQDEKML